MGKKRNWIIVIWIFITLYIAFIWINSMQAGEVSLGMSGPIANAISRLFVKSDPDGQALETIHRFVRKSAHFFEYCGLSVAFCFAYYLSFCKIMPGQKKAVLNSLLIFISVPTAFLTAVIDEGIQTLTPGRNGNFNDVLLDSGAALAGALLFFVAFVALHIIFIQQKKKNNSKT